MKKRAETDIQKAKKDVEEKELKEDIAHELEKEEKVAPPLPNIGKKAKEDKLK